jgi:ribosome-associated heat shock protein Hsp15
MDKVRVDKWLWAARFYKTRALAKVAVESGKVKLDGKKIKPSRQIEIDDTLLIRKNYDDFVIEIKDLADRRVSAAKSRILYEETPESIYRRKVERAQRKLQHSVAISNGRPNKKQRRLIHKLLES